MDPRVDPAKQLVLRPAFKRRGFFSKLPMQLKHMIWTYAARQPRKKRELSKYARVNKEWARVFEPLIFRTLVLDKYNLDSFVKYTKGREGLIQHIWLRVVLPESAGDPGLKHWDGLESPGEAVANNSEITYTVAVLFNHLASWEKGCHALTLELSVWAADDKCHNFRHLQFAGEKEKRPMLLSPIGDSMIKARNDVTCSSDELPSVKDFNQIFGRDIVFSQGVKIPMAHVVKRLIINRETRRRIEPVTLMRLLKALPGLQSVFLQSWRPAPEVDLRSADRDFVEALRRGVSSSVKHFTIFEHFDWDRERAIIRERGGPVSQSPNDRPCSSDLALSLYFLAARHRTIAKIAVAFIMPAERFIEELDLYDGSDRCFLNLEYLSLTCCTLTEAKESIHDILKQAVSLIARMPSLKIGELWYGSFQKAALFRFDATTCHREPTISWRGDKRIDVSLVCRHWNESGRLLYRTEVHRGPIRVFDEEEIKKVMSYGDALKLLRPLILPMPAISIEQAAMEAGHYQRLWDIEDGIIN